MSKILRYLACLFMLIFVGNALAAGYSCPTYVKYTSCNSGYYISNCGSTWNGQTISSGSLTTGNTCKTCPSGYTCTGGLVCPKANTVKITLNKNGGTGTCGGTSSTTAGSVTCTPGSSCSLPSWNSSTCSMTNGNKIFKGWSTSSSATSGVTTITPSGAATYYAVWVTPTCSATNGSCTITTPSNNAPRATITCNTGYSQSGGTNATTSFTATGSAGATSVTSSCSARSYSCSAGNYLNGTSCAQCAAGYACAGGTWTYNGGIQGRITCAAGSYSSGSGATECTYVTKGWYGTGCAADNTRCTGQQICSGAYYCEGGLRKACFAPEEGWKAGTGEGWYNWRNCFEYKEATSISSYCSAGQLVKYLDASNAWWPESMTQANGFSAKAGGYVTGIGASATCAACTTGKYCKGGTEQPTTCPTNYPNSASGASAITQCYSNTKTRAWTGSQVNGSVPTNCYSVTAWNACSNPSCSYVAYSNSAGTGDGTIKSGCATNNANCTKTADTTTGKSGYYGYSNGNGAACSSCSSFNSSYPLSDNGATSSNYCYANKTKTGSQVNGSVPTNCAAVTSWNSCTPGTCTYKDYYNATDTTCTPSNCTKTPAAVTAKAGYYDAGTSCSDCPSGYPNSDAGNDGGITKCYSNSKSRPWTGSQVNGSIPTNCAAVTSWNACSNPACSYVAYSNSTGNGDGTVKSGCSTNSASCTKTPAAVTANKGYYDAGTSCSACPSGYPNSDAGNDGGITKCYSNTKKRAWTGSQTACALPTGCETKTCNSCSIAACDYVSYSNSTGNGDGTLKSGCSTNNESCQQTVASVTASAGRYVSGTTCPACAAGTYQGTDGSTATSCSACSGRTKYSLAGASACSTVSAGYYTTGCDTSGNKCTNQSACGGNAYYCSGGVRNNVSSGYYSTGGTETTRTGQSQCTGATYCSGGVKNNCPTNYDDETTTAGKTSASQCKISCSGGYRVTSANAACSAITSGNVYIGAHSVAYGSTSPAATSCPASYTISGTTAADHDAKSDCKISCSAGTQVVSADAACTTPDGSWYTGTHTVSAGSTSGTNVKSCVSGYATADTTTKTDHDASTDCKISCGAGTRVVSANAACTTPSGNWYVGAHSVAQGSTSSVNSCLTNYTITGTAATNHDTASDCKISCGGGEYIATANDTSCEDVGAGYWAAASTVSQGSAGVRNACDAGLTTIGSGAGADEAGDCGRVLNVNGEKIYLRSDKKTTPSLNVSISGKTFYGNMGTSTVGSLKIKSSGTTYSVYDDSMK